MHDLSEDLESSLARKTKTARRQRGQEKYQQATAEMVFSKVNKAAAGLDASCLQITRCLES